MDRRSTKRLRLDRRLVGRRDWTSHAELQKEIEALPDAGHKAADPGSDAPEGRPADANAAGGGAGAGPEAPLG